MCVVVPSLAFMALSTEVPIANITERIAIEDMTMNDRCPIDFSRALFNIIGWMCEWILIVVFVVKVRHIRDSFAMTNDLSRLARVAMALVIFAGTFHLSPSLMKSFEDEGFDVLSLVYGVLSLLWAYITLIKPWRMSFDSAVKWRAQWRGTKVYAAVEIENNPRKYNREFNPHAIDTVKMLLSTDIGAHLFKKHLIDEFYVEMVQVIG